ncbi:Helix-turn-helix [Actinokineospora alba]|uniref:Helix-turn-helix n=1 Tax=Actinokineospora alba TaxID=504798 RepID=A0A1H0LRW0_9PSEU|nr:helix-turn-helix protein [Actinokineospora alba]SDI96970.1 Helix-turn-helix [Actinokineospora alba]SDO70948.1 Helix-turn-helix [Actinokineospora alba]
MRVNTAAYRRILGDEIRRSRKQRGWTRKDLQERLQTEISQQTLAAYELGTRQCSVLRLAEICLALGEPPQELMVRVHNRFFGGTVVDRIRVDLRSVVAERSTDLLPLRRWAFELLARPTGSTPAEVYLDHSAIERMAELCGIDNTDLVARLRALRPVELVRAKTDDHDRVPTDALTRR